MVKRMNLRTRIYIVLITLVLITVSGGAIMVWYTYRIQGFLNTVIDKNVATFQAAEALEIALVNQKGFVSYYYLDKDPEWLKLLGEYRQVFKERLEEVHLNIGNKGEKEAISRIESEYMRYIDLKDEVIRHYKEGSLNTATRLHREVRDLFFEVLELTEDFKEMVLTQINEARDHTLSQTRRLRIISGIAVTNVFLLGTLLVAILSGQIFVPLRRLASEADVDGGEDESENEVQAVSRSITGLMRDAAHSRSQLEKSQEILLQSEKMALVGKLAAGTAHSIRNPLTSVKMRLFSLSKSLKLNAYQKEDFDVISTEINHIDTILENFLEFSRPAKLKMQRVNPAHVVDMALKLLQHRLQSYHVDVELDRQGSLPDIQADPDQLKEVLVNIIVNACEAMEGGGLIIIGERMTLKKSLGQIVEIRIKDNGPGIPESMQGEVFQPFFSTKEEGTGLGLSIATRIIEQHGGLLEVTSNLGEGTTFMISLPMKETGIE
ncbi:MAG: ATP-binding protein [Thermodesulfobacteriota bacterium]|nr:ATP-binding protein [Thermodesulfobacteriota bacterium]